MHICAVLINRFHVLTPSYRLEEFYPSVTLPPQLEIYTWPDCTLRELTHCLVSQKPEVLPSPPTGTRIAFRLIFPDTRPPLIPTNGPQAPRFLTKELGSVVVGAPPNDEKDAESRGAQELSRLEGEAMKTLRDARFVIGDYISCAVFPPLANGAVVPPPAVGPERPRGFGGSAPRGIYGGPPPRENGYSGGFRSRGGRGGYGPDFPRGGLGPPLEEWRRGERLPGGSAYGGGYGRGRGRSRGW